MPNLFQVEPPMNPSPSTDNVIANTELLKETVGWTCKNKFAPNYIGYEMALFGDSQGAYINNSTGGLTYLARVETDTDYTVSKKNGVGNSFIIAGFATLPPIPSTTPAADSEIIIDDNTLDIYTFNSDDYQYIAFTVNKGSGDSHTLVNTAQGMIHNAEILDGSYEPWHDNVDTVITALSNSLLNRFYPVGTIYETTNGDFNPNTTWGGTWSKIEGKFLLGSSTSYIIGDTGGEATHTLTVNEMPSHKHTITADLVNTTPDLGEFFGSTTTGNVALYDVTTTDTNDIGGDQSHNNMPPYQVVNIWKRTA